MIKIDDTWKIYDTKLRGRKPKFKCRKDGKDFIFKYNAVNYEIWAELIAEQLGLQAGIDMAHYEIAECNGIYGVITPIFLNANELIVSGDKLKLAVQSLLDENNFNVNLKDNTVTNIVQAASLYDERIDMNSLSYELMLRWAFSGLILESDKNATNIGFIKGEDALRLAPDYDNSTMAMLNNNINDNISALRMGKSIYAYTDDVKNDLHMHNNGDLNFLDEFRIFVDKYPEYAISIMSTLKNVNVAEAIEKIQEINGVEVPWEVSYWTETVIESRYDDMLSIYKNCKQVSSKVLVAKK